MNITVYFDFVCPFTNRFHDFLQTIEEEEGLDITWQPFMLAEQNRDEEGHVWDELALNEHPATMTQAGLEAARTAPTETADYVREAFMLWHSSDKNPTLEEVQDLHEKFELDVTQDNIDAVIKSHQAAKDQDVFGSPSALFAGAKEPVFVKLNDMPTSPREAFQNITNFAADEAVGEVKKP